MPDTKTIADRPPVGSKRFIIQLLATSSAHEISAWPGNEAALGAAIHGIPTVDADGEQFLFHMSPQRYWLSRTNSATAHEHLNSIDAENLAITDLSHALSVIRLSGTHVTEVLAKGLPIDLHPREFPAGSVATSAIEGIVVTVCNTGHSFDVYCRRSYTESLSHWLNDAAQEIFATS